MKQNLYILLAAAFGLIVTGCDKGSTTYSLLATSQDFQQTSKFVNNKVDILWVVDNSGSMDPLQLSMTKNFNSFITRFEGLGFDYKMAVTTSDAYLADANYWNQPSLAKFRDGAGSFHTGFFYITPWIPDIIKNFVANATQGSAGSGDERVFQSMLTALNSPLNADFRRPDAFFSIIILSDEDDFTDVARPEFSWLQKGGVPDHDYTNSRMPSVDSVISALDQMTSSTPANRRYNVSAITVLDNACQQAHKAQSSVTIVGKRYMDLATKTNGVLGSICDPSYASTLNFIQQQILELSTEFKLDGNPVPSSIVVTVDGVRVPQDANNGWSYLADSNSIRFRGTAVPSASAQVRISFDPVSLNF